MLPIAVHQNTLRQENEEDPPRPLDELISIAYDKNPIPSRILKTIKNENHQLPPDLTRLKIPLTTYTERDERLYIKKRLFIPENDELRFRLLQSYHDNIAVEHPEKTKTYELLSRHYY